jgi:hypothetical protein
VTLPAVVDLDAYRGDTWSSQFRFLTAPDVPLDLSGSVVASWAYRLGQVEQLLVTVGPDPGVVAITWEAGAPSPGVWRYDVEVTDPTGLITTWVRGIINVVQDVTHSV